MIWLTEEERERFATYLEEYAASDGALAEQLDKVGPHFLAKKYRAEALAAKVIAAKLRETHEETVEGTIR